MGTKKAKKTKTAEDKATEVKHYATHKDMVVLDLGKFIVAKDDNGMYLTSRDFTGTTLLDPYRSRQRNVVSDNLLEVFQKVKNWNEGNTEDGIHVKFNVDEKTLSVKEYFSTVESCQLHN